MIKKSLVSELPGPSAQAFTIAKINKNDSLAGAFLSQTTSDLLILTAGGMAIRFAGEEVRPMNLGAAGVNAIKLAGDDQVISAVELTGKGEFLFVASDGSGWRMEEDSFPVQGRYGQGVSAAKLKAGAKLTGLLYGKKNQSGIVIFKKAASKSIRLDEIPTGKRTSAAKPVLPVKAGDQVLYTYGPTDMSAYWQRKTMPVKKKAKIKG